MLKAPFSFTKEEYISAVYETQYEDDELQKMIDQACYHVYMLAQRNSTINWSYKFKNHVIKAEHEEAFKEAAIEQLRYYEENGIHIYSDGYVVSNNMFLTNAELENKFLSPMSKLILNNAGMLYRGIL